MTNNSYQRDRGASRHQPQPQQQPAVVSKKPLPGWAWLAGGMVIGTFAVFLFNLKPGNDAIKNPEAAAPAATQSQPTPASAPVADEPPKPKYDFYTLLPDSKVIVPPGTLEEPATPPPPEPSMAPSTAATAAAAAVVGAGAAALASKALQSQAPVQPKPVAPAAVPAQKPVASAPALAPVQKPVQPVAPANTLALKPAVAPVTVTTNTATAAKTTTVAPPANTLAKPAPANPAALAATTRVTPVAPVAPAAPVAAAKPVAAPAPAAPVVTAVPASRPLAVAPAPAASAPALAATPAPAPAAPVPAPTLAKAQPLPSPAAAPAAPAKPQQLFLQAGSFRKSDDADRVRAEMLLIGVSARIETSNVKGEPVHRVVIGPYSSPEKLAQAQKQLSENGFGSLMQFKR